MVNFKTAECVSPQHPDKLCDQISDAILDAYLAKDPHARVAVETVGGHGKVFVVGEVTSTATVDIAPIVQRLAGDVECETRLVQQSPEIARGVNTGGAGDQGIMVGYATSETPELLPTELVRARQLNQYLFERWPFDGKTQVTIQGDAIVSIVASFQHAPQAELAAAVTQWVATHQRHTPTLHINPTGDWQQGGFSADTGLTGRKLVVDNYGPRVAVGGGAFSGKDPSKVDRSAAYMARKIAVDYLRQHHAREVFVQLAYAIGYDQPLQATALINGAQHVVTGYDLSPNGIIASLQLQRPVYEQTARWGHFGHSEFSWEQ